MKLNRIAQVFLLAIVAAAFVLAEPTGPTSPITPISTGRYSTSSAQTHGAIAGNVTEINLNANTITQSWQGYFGNITGTVVLGDSSNNTFYDWSLSSPQGEIYATRLASTPTWATVGCANSTHINSEDTALGIDQANDADAVNKTFLNTTNFSPFYVGSVLINQSSQNCYATYLYNNTGAQSTYFPEVLLSDTAGNMIYTGLVENNAMGFNNRTHDFEILVGENGHSGDAATTTYYFYLELE